MVVVVRVASSRRPRRRDRERGGRSRPRTRMRHSHLWRSDSPGPFSLARISAGVALLPPSCRETRLSRQVHTRPFVSRAFSWRSQIIHPSSNAIPEERRESFRIVWQNKRKVSEFSDHVVCISPKRPNFSVCASSTRRSESRNTRRELGSKLIPGSSRNISHNARSQMWSSAKRYT